MFTKVLIANRSAIACRIIRTLKKLGINSVAVYSEADLASLHVAQADEAVCIGRAPAAESYLRGEKILDVARATGAQAIHPGYGFLSENADFAEACERTGIAFIGPSAEQMRAFGLKHRARELAQKNGVPLLPGSGLLADMEQARVEAMRIGYPAMLKSTAGGGGIGMRLIRSASELAEAYASVDRLTRANFRDAGLYLEKYVEQARHVARSSAATRKSSRKRRHRICLPQYAHSYSTLRFAWRRQSAIARREPWSSYSTRRPANFISSK